MTDTWKHDVLTGGREVRILPLNIAGERAHIEKRIEIAKRGDPQPELKRLTANAVGIELLEVVVYHTLDRVVDGITIEKVRRFMDGEQARELAGIIAKVNGWDRPKATTAPQPQAG